jgi:sugar phosphate isomerase/epimerase
MMQNIGVRPSRRTFLKQTAVCASILSSMARAASTARWTKHMGLELYTVRDLIAKDMEGTVAKVAEIGYKEVEPTEYGKMEPKAFRAMLDRYGLTAPSTHAGATEGPDLEKQLAGFQTIGIRYTEIRGSGGGGGRSGPTEESVKRQAQEANRHGQIARKFGMKILIHNHTQEFEMLEGGKLRPYDILLAETDRSLVAMQLDIGWASVAGQNILQMFQKSPGRFELWHVKDATGIKSADPRLTPNERRKVAKLVPVGQGEIDYHAIFAKADQAGLKHFCIEQDNAAEGGDSMAAAKASYQGLTKELG